MVTVTTNIRRRFSQGHGNMEDVTKFTKTASKAVVAGVQETWLLTKLAFMLLGYIGIGWRWSLRLGRLLVFVLLLLPGFLQVLNWYIRCDDVKKNVVYAKESRNNMDIYVPPFPPKSPKGYPVFVFYSGGAWIIGYKCWGALMGKVLSQYGVLFIAPDYRNFPQGRVTDMLADVNNSMKFVFDNCHAYGGDPENVYIAGQSAGAHLSTLALLTEAERERRVELKLKNENASEENDLWNGYTHDFREEEDSLKWRVSKIKGYIGISGVYDLAGWANYLHERGLYRSVLSSICCHDLSFYSPTRRVALPSFNPNNELPLHSVLPPITLLHGTADESIPHSATITFAQALKRAGIHAHVKYYENKSHTDPIIEDPMEGGSDQLIMDIFSIISAEGDLCRNNPCSAEASLSKAEMLKRKEQGKENLHHTVSESRCLNVDPKHFGFEPKDGLVAVKWVKLARQINPF